MAAGDKFPGRLMVVTLDDSGGNARVISGDVRVCTVGDQADQADVSGAGQTRKSSVVGLSANTVSLEGPFNKASNRAHAVLSSLIGGTAGYTFLYQPAGTASGLPKFTGEVFLQTYEVTSDINGATGYRATLNSADENGITWTTN